MLTINELSKSHGARVLFQDASIQFNPGGCYGIVGANGTGKSTILRIIAGDEEPSSGEVSFPKKARLGWLNQDHFRFEDTPIIDVVLMGLPELWAAMEAKERLLADTEGDFDADKYAELEDTIMRLDGYTAEAKASEILEGLNIASDKHREPMSILSGGYKLRVLLAQVLASRPDILLLDEPTNHLDIVSIAWLEKFLKAFKGVTLVVSHDRHFLNSVCTHICDLDYDLVTLYKGNYAKFEESKVAQRERKEGEIDKREKEIADHKRFVERFRAKATKARQAQSRLKQMAKLTIDKLPQSSRQFPTFKFKSVRHSGKEVVSINEVCKSYDDKQVLFDVSLTVQRHDRIGIIGPNGIGKSTLLKIMLGHLEADIGEVEWGYETYPGYFSQDHSDVHVAENETLHSWLWNICPDQGTGFVRGKLAEVLFTQDDVEKRVHALSGGETARLVFAKLVVEQPNVLVLDEPTNHLDIEGIEALAAGLKKYDGTLIFVSHDRWFVGQLANRIISITEDGVDDFRGTYEEYLRKQGDDHLDQQAVLEAEKSKKKRGNNKKKRG